MMNIREYFDEMALAVGYDEMLDKQDEIYEMYENDFEGFKKFCEAEDIDLTITQTTITGHTETILTSWVWDMCEE